MSSGEQQRQQQQQHDAAGARSPSPTPTQEQLWEWFVVVGLPTTGLQTVHGEQGFLGTDQKYKPAFADSLPHSAFDESCRLPPQLPTCCLPAGIDIVLYQDLALADLTPHTFACVLTEGDGTKVYASCLTFYDRVPPDLCAKHEDLLGAVALKALCLLSRRPYLASSQQVLRELYASAFQRGSLIPLGDLINSLLAVPCPQQGGPKLCLRLCGSRRMVCPPLSIGPPPGEVSLQPLLEVMQPDSLVGLFAAVLLEQRVLIRCRHHWLLTVAAEGIVRLLYPLKYQHVYIPVMPCSLADYLEAPTPFLMGLHSAEPLEQRLLDSLVVADLDRGTLHLGKDDGLMRRCLSHPYMRTLERRVRMLMQPSVTDADVVATHGCNSSSHADAGGQEDSWLAAARALGPGAAWSPSKQALLLRVFMQFFQEVLQDYHLFLSSSSGSSGGSGGCSGSDAQAQTAGAGAAAGSSSLGRRDSRLTSGGGSSGGAALVGRALRGALSGVGGGAGGAVAGAVVAAGAVGRSSSLAAGAGGLLHQAQSLVGLQALLDHHAAICRHTDPALLQQVMQGLPFLCFVGEHSSLQEDPTAWLRAGEASLGAWRASEEEVWGRTAAAPVAAAAGAAGGEGTVVVCIPDQPPSALMPPRGLLHTSFPLLVLSEYSERALQGQGGGSSSSLLMRRRKTAGSRQKRPSVGRRRAISELMGSPLDLRRKTPLPGTNTDISSPRLLRGNPLDTVMPSGGPGGAGSAQQQQLAPGLPLPLPSLAKISNVSSSSTNAGSLSEEYSAEADLIGRQIGMLVLLMQAASTAAAVSSDASAAAAGAAEVVAPAAAGGGEAAGSPGPSNTKAPPGGFMGGASASAAAVLRRYSSNGARSSSSRAQLSPDVLEAARQLLCIQTGGNGWFIVSRLKELVANPPAPFSEADASSKAAAAAADGRHHPGGKGSIGGAAAAAAAAIAAAAAGKKGADAAAAAAGGGGKGSSPQGGKGTMLAKSGKLLGVNLSGGSSSKSSGLAGLKVSHGVESFASAASAMASVISRNASATKQQKQQSAATSGSSAASSPTNTCDTSKVVSSTSSAPSSTCGAGSGLGAPHASAAAFHHSASCKIPDHREHRMAAAVTSSEGGAAPGAAEAASALSSTDSSVSVVVSSDAQPTPAAAAATSPESALGSPPAEAAAAAGAGTTNSAGSSSSSGQAKPSAQQQQQQQQQHSSNGSGPVERCVPADIFGVLCDMLNAIVEVAAGHDDSRVVLTVLELASVITCNTGGSNKVYLLSRLAGNPVMHTECFWAAAFGFAVSSSYLTDSEFSCVRGVVTKCLQQFACYLGGIGVPDTAAYVLLMQIGSDHLQLAHAEPLEPAAQLAIRQRISQARQQQLGLTRPPPAAPPLSTTSSAAAAAAAAEPAGAIPPHVAASLRVCGISLPGCADQQQQLQQLQTGTAAAEPDAWCSSSSASWLPDAPEAGGGDGQSGWCRAAVTILAPGAEPERPSSSGGSSAATATARTSVSSVVVGSAASDTEAPVVAAALRPMGSLTPASPAAAAAGVASPSGSNTPQSTPFGLSPRGGAGLASSASTSTLAGSARVPSVSTRTAKEGYGSYAKLLNRQAAASSSSPTAAAAAAAAPPTVPGDTQGGGGDAAQLCAEGTAAAASPALLSVHGGCLADQGALQWAAVHSGGVVALAASSYTAVSAGLDGCMKVLDLSGGKMRLAASMQIPSLAAADAAQPVLHLWHDGRRAAVGNARHQAVWIVDLAGGRASLELSGLGSAVSCLFPLYRNPDALLAGLTHGGVVCGHAAAAGTGSTSSSDAAAAYLWDLRRPKRPASSLNFTPEAPSAAAGVVGSAAAAAADDAAGGSSGSECGVPGILCLSVHEDGALAAAGFRDGKVLTWDMRQPGVPLSECQGHTGPVNHVSFLPAAASAAAGLGRLPLLLTGSDDWTARLWEAQSGTCRGACVGHGGAVTAMQTVHSSTSTRCVTGAADGSIGVWGLDGELCSLVQQHDRPVMLLRQGGDTLVSGAADKSCNVWGVQGFLLPSGSGSSSSTSSCSGSGGMVQPSRLLATQRKPAAVSAMTFDPVSEMLCAGHRDGLVSVWNANHSTHCATIFE